MPKPLKFFPQSFAVDEVLSKRMLQYDDYQFTQLAHPILYRGDTRKPDIIFTSGFTRRIENIPIITYLNASISCVACTKDLVYAVGFADDPDKRFGRKKTEYSWVYALSANKGYDLSNDPTHRNTDNINAAKSVNEVALLYVPKENIIAAFQIKQTENTISVYHDKRRASNEMKNKIAWQILVTDLQINPACSLKFENPTLYNQVIAEFTAIKNNGYYRIPWSPFAEESDPNKINMHLLADYQQEALQKGYVASTHEAEKIIYVNPVEALKLSLSKQKTIATHYAKLFQYDLDRKKDLFKQNNHR